MPRDYDVLQSPFVFRSQTKQGQMAVCEVDDHLHIAVGSVAVPITTENMDHLAEEWCKYRKIEVER